MDLSTNQLSELLVGMRAAYARGDNAMAYARETLSASASDATDRNHHFATLVAYDLQAGSYVAGARANPDHRRRWCRQLADLIEPMLPAGGRLLEVGVGEATTMAGVLAALGTRVGTAFGFDISWSRIRVANEWLQEHTQSAELFVGDLTHIPLADNSMDVVYSSHSLEPNGGREEAAIAECLRVASRAVVLVEPLYELASDEAQARMRQHGYVRGLRATAEKLGALVKDYRLLERVANPLNPSGVLTLYKDPAGDVSDVKTSRADSLPGLWRCPLTGAALESQADLFFAPDVGIAYPVLRAIPLLRPEHAVVASGLGSCLSGES